MSPGDLTRLAVAQTSVRDHQLTLVNDQLHNKLMQQISTKGV